MYESRLMSFSFAYCDAMYNYVPGPPRSLNCDRALMHGCAHCQRPATLWTRDVARCERTHVSRAETNTLLAQACSAMTTCSNGAPSRWNRPVMAVRIPIAIRVDSAAATRVAATWGRASVGLALI